MPVTRPQLSVQLSVLLATACIVFLLIGGAADAEEPPAATDEYLVIAGDTLWDIAADHVPPEADVRPFLREIREANGLTSSALRPGQVLRLPHP